MSRLNCVALTKARGLQHLIIATVLCSFAMLSASCAGDDKETETQIKALNTRIEKLEQDLRAVKENLEVLMGRKNANSQDDNSKGVQIEITIIPKSGLGENSRGTITGNVRGLDNPEDYKVILFAHTNRWWVQPLADDPETVIDTKGEWTNWTHLGSEYAALVIRPPYAPPPNPISLPKVGDRVLAIKVVPASK